MGMVDFSNSRQRYSLCNIPTKSTYGASVLLSVAGVSTMNLHSQYNVKILLIYMLKKKKNSPFSNENKKHKG